jgi:restriction system protein
MATDQYADDLVKVFFQTFVALWYMWVFLSLLAAAYISLGVYRRLRIARSGLKDIDGMSGRDFERYLKFLFSKLGFKVQQTAAHGDFGADLVASNRGERVVIQAKRYRRKVGVKAVQEAVAAKGYYSCDKAMVVTNSFFTRQAATLAHRNDVSLWDRNRLAKAMDSIGGKRAVSQALASEEPVPSQPAMFSADVDASPSGAGAVCAICGQRVSEKVRDYCLANQGQFDGRILCYHHQRTR